MDNCVYMDYREKDTCCWEPKGNGHFLTRCGNLAFDRKFSPTRDKTCRFCNREFNNSTYINMHEKLMIKRKK